MRERELARQLSSRFDEWDQRPREDGVGGVPRGLERPSEAETTPVRADSTLVSTTQQDHQQLARFHFDCGLRLEEQQQDRDAITEFRRSLYLSPYDAQTHLALGRAPVRSGRLRDAIESLKISLWSAESLDARLLLAEALLGTGETAEALVHAERALQLAPESTVARALVERIRVGHGCGHPSGTLQPCPDRGCRGKLRPRSGRPCIRHQPTMSPRPPSPRVLVLGARMAHELHEDGFHEIQLSGKQLVFLFMATTVVSIVIFLCGVLVGRGVQNARGLLHSASATDSGRREARRRRRSYSPGDGRPDAGDRPELSGEPAGSSGRSRDRRARCSRRDDANARGACRGQGS